MTEAEWLTAADPKSMLGFLQSKASERKLRLFACACCRRIDHLLTLDPYQKALDLAEKYADQPPAVSRFKSANTRLWKARQGLSSTHQHDAAMTAVIHCFHVGVEEFAQWAAETAFDAEALEGYEETPDSEPNYAHLRATHRSALSDQSRLLVDIIGNPFRPVTLDASWLASTVHALATRIYDEKAFDRMPILADALQDAGCDNEDILNHCRQASEHVRGCWVVDLVLDRG
jgi:hypothetical protein